MVNFKEGDRVRFDDNVNSENSRSYQLSSNLEYFYRKYKNQIFIVRQYDKNDNTVYVFVEGQEFSSHHNTWLDAKCVELIIDEPALATDIGNSVERIQVVNYKFENQIYNDKKQVLGILLNKIQKINPNNFSEVMKKLKEIEETWNRM